MGGSSCVMPVMVTVSGSLSGSVRPRIDTATNAWLGGQSSAGFGRAPLQTGGALTRCRVVVVGSSSVVVVGSTSVVVVRSKVLVVGREEVDVLVGVELVVVDG